jgi:hypothetical protein
MFRFTIRDLLWLTVVVGVAAAWWVDHRMMSLWEYRGVILDMELRARGWTVVFLDDGGLILEPPGWRPDPPAQTPNLPKN